MTYNLEAMSRTLEWAEAGGDEESEFDITGWARQDVAEDGTVCGTTLCLAGKAAHDADYTFDWRCVAIRSDPDEPNRSARNVVLSNGRVSTVKEAGAVALGLRMAEAQALFVPELEIEGATTKEEEKFALDFLRYLIERAENEQPNMTGPEVYRWVGRWSREHEARQ